MDVILTHENADFDAVASLVGAHKLFPIAVPVLPRRVNRNGRAFLALYGAELDVIQQDELPDEEPITRAILVDTQGLSTLRHMVDELRVDIIDHHELDREIPDHWTYAGEPMGATTTLLVEEIAAQGIKLSRIEATLLLLGIYEDTGSLSYSTTTVRDVRAAAWLMEQDASLSVVNEFLHHPLTPAQRELYEALLEASETHAVEGHTIIVAPAQAPDFDGEISTLAHKLRDILEPAALFVLVALDGRVQLVARSTTDDVDVSVIAGHFGGGGHQRAAAALIRERSLRQAVDELLALLPEVVQPAVTVGQVMSRGVQVLQPTDTVADAAEHMRRTGHEGYPVVRQGQVIGLLTRRAVDRALQFEMADAPVTQIMEAGNITVSSTDSVEWLQQLMIESGWGQIPVVEDERIVGVVTRTDLITLWGTPPTTTPQPDVIALLKSGISPPVLALVRHISRVADEMGLVPYFVGGLVRDLLLGQQVFDIDMVIEGEAIKLAKHLVDSLGGEIRTHRRFGTAKWFLTPEVWRAVGESADEEDLPATIDFVTARTEFYTYPTALPQIEHSSIKQDLHRRDFTINTLAIRLDPEHWGQLLDFYGGRADLQEGQIRVLHSLSFVDDPTRMLRAVRLETRLGFSLEPRTRELIADGLPLLKRVSGDRIRHELALIFREEEPEKVLRRLGELDILHHIHPQLCCDEWVVRKYEALRTRLDPEVWQLEDEDDFFLHVALLAYRMEPAVIQTLCTRLKMPRDDSEDLEMLHTLQESFAQLGKARRPSFVYRLLEPYAARVLAVAWLATDRRAIKNRLWRYQTEWRLAEPAISGADLKEMGLRPGPLFGRLLRTLRDARLDGRVSTLAEEQALLQTLLAQEREEK